MGNDLDELVQAFQPFLDVGYDEIFISQMGGAQPDTSYDGFFSFYAEDVLPRLRSLAKEAGS